MLILGCSFTKYEIIVIGGDKMKELNNDSFTEKVLKAKGKVLVDFVVNYCDCFCPAAVVEENAGPKNPMDDFKHDSLWYFFVVLSSFCYQNSYKKGHL